MQQGVAAGLEATISADQAQLSAAVWNTAGKPCSSALHLLTRNGTIASSATTSAATVAWPRPVARSCARLARSSSSCVGRQKAPRVHEAGQQPGPAMVGGAQSQAAQASAAACRARRAGSSIATRQRRQPPSRACLEQHREGEEADGPEAEAGQLAQQHTARPLAPLELQQGAPGSSMRGSWGASRLPERSWVVVSQGRCTSTGAHNRAPARSCPSHLHHGLHRWDTKSLVPHRARLPLLQQRLQGRPTTERRPAGGWIGATMCSCSVYTCLLNNQSPSLPRPLQCQLSPAAPATCLHQAVLVWVGRPPHIHHKRLQHNRVAPPCTCTGSSRQSSALCPCQPCSSPPNPGQNPAACSAAPVPPWAPFLPCPPSQAGHSSVQPTCGPRPAVQLVQAPPPEALEVDMPPLGAEGQDGLALKGGEGEVGGRTELSQLAHALQ